MTNVSVRITKMASEAPEAAAPAAQFSATDVAEILVKHGWLAADSRLRAEGPMAAWLRRASELLGPHAADRTTLAGLLSLVFEYDAAAVLRAAASQDVLARDGARDVIRELANRVLDGGDIDSDRFKEIVDGIKTALPQRSRELFHPIRLALAGRAGEGELDRAILLVDSAVKLQFTVPVKGTRQRMLEFCAALD
jgi:hypothetical protein